MGGDTVDKKKILESVKIDLSEIKSNMGVRSDCMRNTVRIAHAVKFVFLCQ